MSEPWKWGEYKRPADAYDTALAGTRFLMCGYDAHAREFASGDWVRYSDYARLKAEVERLTELVESNLNSYKVAMSKADTVLHERDRLKAEVERLEINDYKNLSMRIEIDKLNAKINRLVKAGDKMVLCIDGDYNYQTPCVQAWSAAKYGKPL